MNNDPNWLLSSVTQSSAALVAILGGFLFSRLVGINSDRRNGKLQYDSFSAQIALAEREKKKLALQIESRVRKLFEEWNLETIIENRDNLDLDKIQYPVGAEVLDGFDLTEEYLSEVKAAFTFFESEFTNSELISEDWRQGRQVGKLDEVWDKVRVFLNAQRQPKKFGIFGIPSYGNILGGISEPPIVGTRYENSLQKWRELDSHLLFLVTQRKLLEFTFNIEEVKNEMLRAWKILGVFSLLGIVYPMALLTFVGDTLSIPWRISVTFLFFVGLVLLLVYLRKSVLAIKSGHVK
jgi:hypothetical protein